MTDVMPPGSTESVMQVIDLQELDQVKVGFTELGDAIKGLSESNQSLFEKFSDAMSGDFKAIISELAESSKIIADSEAQVGVSEEFNSRLQESFKSLADQMNTSVRGLGKVLTSADSQFDAMTEGVKALIDSVNASREDKKSGGGSSDPKKPRKSWLGRELKKEGKSILGKANSFLKSLQLPAVGAVAAGVISMMVAGVKDAARVRAETGEMKNILVAAYESGVKGATDTGTRYLGGLQENLRLFYGITRDQLQGVVKSFVDGGLAIEQMMEPIGRKVKGFRDDLIMNAFALDLMFKKASGTSAKQMVNMMADYAKTTEEAAESTIRLNLLGKQSGVGAARFAENVEQASAPLAKLGIDIENVIDTYDFATKMYAKMNVPSQFAGKIAAEGMNQISSGISNMSTAWQIVLAERLYPNKSGLEARQELLDSFLRVQKKDRGNELVKIMQVAWDIAMEASGGDVAKARLYMEQQMGFGFRGAALVFDVVGNAKEGKYVEAAELANKNYDELSKMFGLKRQEKNQIDLFMAQAQKGVALMGRGILGLVMQFISYLMAYFKAIIPMFENIWSGNSDKNDAIFEQIDDIVGSTEANKALVKSGFVMAIRAVKGLVGAALGESLDSLLAAYNFTPKGSKSSGGGPGVVSPDEQGPPLPGTPTLSTPYYVPGGSGFTGGGNPQSIPPAKKGSKGKGASAQGGEPSTGKKMSPNRAPLKELPGGTPYKKGGGPMLEYAGTTPEGIAIRMGGSCPNCGASLVGGGVASRSYSKGDRDTLTQMVFSEMGPSNTISSKAGRTEAIALAFAALNRMEDSDKSLDDIITSGQGWGKQGGKRQFSTARGMEEGLTPAEERERLQIAELMDQILAGEIEDPTQGAKFFYHDTGGVGYGDDKTLMPGFANDRVNTLNVGRARFYADKGPGLKEASDKKARDEKMTREYNQRRVTQAPKVPPAARQMSKPETWGGF